MSIKYRNKNTASNQLDAFFLYFTKQWIKTK